MNIGEKIVSYFRSSHEEMRKVSWPSRQDTIRYSALVIGVSVLVAAFFAALDTGFTKLVDFGITQRLQRQAQQAAPAETPIVTASSSQTVTPTLDFTNTQPIPTPNATSNTAPTPKK